MTIPPTAIVPAALRCRRRSLSLGQQQVATELGISPNTLRRWEQGRDNPPTRQVIAYAALLDRRIMVGRNKIGIHDLANLLPNLGAFRRMHRLTQQQVADRMHITVHAVGKLERAARASHTVGWDSVVRYFTAFGYELGIARLQVAAVAS